MALTLPNPLATKATADFLRRSYAYERPFPADQIVQLANSGALLASGIPGGDITANVHQPSTGATQAILQTHPVSGLLNLIQKYSGGGPAAFLPLDLADLQSAVQLMVVGTAVERPVDGTISWLIYQFAADVGFAQLPPQGFLDALRDAPISTLIYLLYWVGTPNPVNPYTF